MYYKDYRSQSVVFFLEWDRGTVLIVPWHKRRINEENKQETAGQDAELL